MIRLDTHVVVWLYAGELERLSPSAIEALEEHEPAICPMVRLEMVSLNEIGRLRVPAAAIIDDLSQRISLTTSAADLAELVLVAADLDWTRDPFDRLIVADALVSGTDLVTKDQTIRDGLPSAVW